MYDNDEYFGATPNPVIFNFSVKNQSKHGYNLITNSTTL